MKALTICQPYATLICLPESDPRHKRVENRTWPTRHRGPLAIHAGKSLAWLDHEDAADVFEVMPFGAIVGVAELVGCFGVTLARVGKGRGRKLVPVAPADALATWPWLRGHRHVEGPVCWVLQNVRPLARPVPWKGRQGLWDVPDEVLAGRL